MSFGFSVGDILLVSQLTYRVYSALSGSRRLAGKEFESAVFGLRCALDHLGRQADEITARTAHNGSQEAADMRKNLDIMIQSCGTTLMELNNILLKYADDANGPNIAAQPTSTKPKILSLSQVKRTVKVNWLKVRWDLEGKTLIEYREKLQTHTDAINVVLNTFLWSASHRIEMAGDANADQMQRLQHQMLQSNDALRKLTEDMKSILSETRSPTPTTAGGRTVSSGLASMVALPTGAPMTPIGQPPHLEPSSSVPHKTDNPVPRRVNVEGLPPAIIELNKERAQIGLLDHSLFGWDHRDSLQYRSSCAKKRPYYEVSEELFFGARQPTVARIQAELENLAIFATTSSNRSIDGTSTLIQRVHHWLQALEGTVDAWTRVSATTKEDKQTRQHYTLKLILTLNSNLAYMDESTRKTMYIAMDHGGIDLIFAKLRRCLSAVMVEKEMEVFEDERYSCLM